MSAHDKHIMVTGATSGIGLAAAKLLAADGARLTLVARNPEKVQVALAAVRAAGQRDDHQCLEMDFASLASVREAAQQFVARGDTLDVLLNNAGTINLRRQTSQEGYEQIFAVNHLAPFLLTGILLPLLARPGCRIVNVASNSYAIVRGIRFDDLQAQKKYNAMLVYGHSKLANMLFTVELAQRLASSGVLCNSLHPGAVSTGLGTQNSGLISWIVPRMMRAFFKTPEQGAETPVYLCREEEGGKVSGHYFVNRRIVTPKSWATDPAAARRLWEVSEELVDFRYAA
ncbi:MAG: SDR family NAD(P)-dependent oxidoreductase [Halieaceae bacterium]|nr:SDR family NAD(P)-dependent oxidoreductase [Halieaceae bacterium]